MRAYGVALEEIRSVINLVSRTKYDGNLIANRLEAGPGRAITFTLRVNDSRGKGARFSHSGRRMISACWHAHRDVMIVLFNRNPNMRLRTALANYDGKRDFLIKFPDTGMRNVGSLAAPAGFMELCECDGNDIADRRELANVSYVPSLPSKDAHRWTTYYAEKAIDDWNDFVAEIKERSSSRKVKR